MANFSVTLTIPDNTVAQALAALQRLYPAVGGETNLVYIKRIIKERLTDLVNEGQAQLLRDAISGQIVNDGVTTS